MDPLMELLLGLHASDATGLDADTATEAVMTRGRELGYTDSQIYTLLERLADDNLIDRRSQESGNGEITWYRVKRITRAGIEVAEAYLKTGPPGQ